MILKRQDGSYIIDGPAGAYHVPQTESRLYMAVSALVAGGYVALDVTDSTEQDATAAALAGTAAVWGSVQSAIIDEQSGMPSTPSGAELLRARFNEAPFVVEREWRDAISTERLARLKAGFVHSDGNTYPIDPEAQTIFTSMYALAVTGAEIPFMARTADNKNITMTAVEFKSFGEAAFKAGNMINMEAFTAKDAIATAAGFDEKYSVYSAYMNS